MNGAKTVSRMNAIKESGKNMRSLNGRKKTMYVIGTVITVNGPKAGNSHMVLWFVPEIVRMWVESVT